MKNKKNNLIRNKAETEFRKSENKMNNLLDSVPIGIVNSTPDGRIVEVNTFLLTTFGYASKEEFISIPAEAHYNDLNERKRFMNLLKKGTAKKIEFRFKHKDGSTFWGSVTSATTLSKAKKIEYVSVIEDITKRKKTEMELNLLQKLTMAISESTDFEQALKTAIRLTCENTGWEMGEAWIPTHNNTILKYYLSYFDDSNDHIDRIKHFIKASKKYSFPPEVGLPGRVWLSKRPEWHKDISNLSKEQYLRSELSKESGLKATLGIPIISNDQVLTVLVFYKFKQQLEDEHQIKLVSTVASQLGSVIQRKLAEEQIKKDLKIKTALIQEIYHRTKNNMAVISAMLSMESGRSENGYVKSTFREIRNKIQAMSLVQQKLYKAKDLSNINLKEYIEDLAKLIMRSYGALSAKIEIKYDLHDVKISIDSAIPLGLIINELVSNIFKHAFPNRQEGEIFIRLFKEEDETINLELGDNGIGFPKNFDPRKDGSMGLVSVFSIAENQLKGEISVKSENGLRWHIKIKDDLHKERV